MNYADITSVLEWEDKITMKGETMYKCQYSNNEDIIEELEKLKLEMSPDSDDVWQVWNRTAVKIIDRHIAELKGENNVV